MAEKLNDANWAKWAQLENRALRVVHAISKQALDFFKSQPPVEIKPDRSLVSAADRALEKRARDLLAKETPEIGFYGEEFGLSRSSLDCSDSDRAALWILDPIDGTSNFLSQVPTWSILLAYVEDGVPQVGVVCFPALNEIFSASKGNGATFGSLDEVGPMGFKPVRKCKGSSQVNLEDAHIAYSSVSQFNYRGVNAFFDHLVAKTREFRTHSDAFGYSRVLCGGIDGMIDAVAAPYDLAAVQVLFSETPGLCFTPFYGEQRLRAFSRGGAIAACTAELHHEMVKSLSGSLHAHAELAASLGSLGPSSENLQSVDSLRVDLSSDDLRRVFHRETLRHYFKARNASHERLVFPEELSITAQKTHFAIFSQNFQNSESSENLDRGIEDQILRFRPKNNLMIALRSKQDVQAEAFLFGDKIHAHRGDQDSSHEPSHGPSHGPCENLLVTDISHLIEEVFLKISAITQKFSGVLPQPQDELQFISFKKNQTVSFSFWEVFNSDLKVFLSADVILEADFFDSGWGIQQAPLCLEVVSEYKVRRKLSSAGDDVLDESAYVHLHCAASGDLVNQIEQTEPSEKAQFKADELLTATFHLGFNTGISDFRVFFQQFVVECVKRKCATNMSCK